MSRYIIVVLLVLYVEERGFQNSWGSRLSVGYHALR
jgi:hypothetical protein